MYALRQDYQSKEGAGSYEDYFLTSMDLFSQLVKIPSDLMMVGLLNAVCEMWTDLAVIDGKIDTIINVTTACLKRSSALKNDLVTSLRYDNTL